MGKLIGFVFGRLFTLLGVTSKLGRVFMGTIFLSLLFVVVFNVACELIGDLMTWAVTKAGSTDLTKINGIQTASVTGAAGWVLLKLKFPECLAMVMASYPIRVLLKAIPFVRLN